MFLIPEGEVTTHTVGRVVRLESSGEIVEAI